MIRGESIRIGDAACEIAARIQIDPVISDRSLPILLFPSIVAIDRPREAVAASMLCSVCRSDRGYSSGGRGMESATIITGALLSQVLLGIVMFVAASILQAHQPRTAMFRGEPLYMSFSWLILLLLLFSVATLVFTHSLSSFWIGLFKNTSFGGIDDQWATLIVFCIDILITTILVANTGGSVDSPFQPIFFLIPTLALLLYETSIRVVVYGALVSIAFTFLLVTSESLHESQRKGAKKAYGFVSISCLALAVLIGLLTRTCPGDIC